MEKTINEQIVELLDKQPFEERLDFANNLLFQLDEWHLAHYGKITDFTDIDLAQVLSYV